MSTIRCPTCAHEIEWIVGIYSTIPETCPSCKTPLNLKGAVTSANFIVAKGVIALVFWYEWDHDMFDDVRADLSAFDAGDMVYDIDPSRVTGQGNGHYTAVVDRITPAERKAREAARAVVRARIDHLRPVALELLEMLFGAPYEFADSDSLHRRTVSALHPQPPPENGKITPAYMAEHRRLSAVTKAWLERLLGEPVADRALIFDVAERWEALGKPRAEACVWSET